MKLKYCLIALFLLIYTSVSYSQTTINGIIENAVDGTPIPYAMVFLTNTSNGTLSDSLGHFSLMIDNGKYELVIRSIGFVTLTYEFEHTEIQDKLYRFKLASDDLVLSELEVNSKRDQAWYGNLEIFKRYFLGTSTNSQKIKLENPNILVLDDQSTPKVLIARANDALLIENANLGYTIRYILQNFEYSKADFRVFYGGYAFFTSDSTLSKRKIKQVGKSRVRAYLGSTMHFMRAVYEGKVEEEGFIVRRLKKIPNINRPDDEELNTIAENFRTGRPTPYSFEEYARLKRLPKTIDVLDKNPLDLSQMIEEGEGGQKVLKFEDYLQVIYTKSKPDQNYPNPQNLQIQESLIHFLNGQIVIYENGSYSPPYDLLFEGYMGWMKTGDMLPLDYYPESK
ncbi:carboxypeptidase-like regulatory domain-containing protein [Belliella marina]|uniref:Carboxypeptidase-like regulatory domain-containing protein n=1 Tax=Belliella marina TaxID=1644146 RepID=A0ABW4VQV0_9BACT